MYAAISHINRQIAMEIAPDPLQIRELILIPLESGLRYLKLDERGLSDQKFVDLIFRRTDMEDLPLYQDAPEDVKQLVERVRAEARQDMVRTVTEWTAGLD